MFFVRCACALSLFGITVSGCTETVSLTSLEIGYIGPPYKAPMMSHTFDLAELKPEALYLSVSNIHGDFFRCTQECRGCSMLLLLLVSSPKPPPSAP